MKPTWILLFLIVFWLFWMERQRRRGWTAKYLQCKNRKDKIIMQEAAKKMIGEDVIIYLLSGEVSGVIREVEDHSALVETQSGRELINLDFVLRIRQHPKNKNGKKKSIVLD